MVLENPARVSRTKQLANQRKARQARDVARKKANVIGRKEAALKGIWDLKEAETRQVSLFMLSDVVDDGASAMSCSCRSISFGNHTWLSC